MSARPDVTASGGAAFPPSVDTFREPPARAADWDGCGGGPFSDDEQRDAGQYADWPLDDRPDAADLAGLDYDLSERAS